VSTLKVDTIQKVNGSVPKAFDLGLNITGNIVKFSTVKTNTSTEFANNSTFTTLLSLNYTPLYADSTLLIEIYCSQVKKTTGGGGWIGVRLDVDDSDTGLIGGAFMYPEAANDTRMPFYGKGELDSWGTTQKTVSFKSYGNGTTAFWSFQEVRTVLSVTEIAG
tara:strand:- start:410 stop:898 length:489 start_codon:yes stop_codon:yes gene_type:complete